MTRDDIIRMAREADVWVAGQEPYQSQLSRFATLVAAHEREECARVCERIDDYDVCVDTYYSDIYAAAIRARKDTQ